MKEARSPGGLEAFANANCLFSAVMRIFFVDFFLSKRGTARTSASIDAYDFLLKKICSAPVFVEL
jgi:hypothetical protein